MDKKEINIVYKGVDELIPYVNNPRDNAGAVDAVASSIKNFGFKVPIVFYGAMPLDVMIKMMFTQAFLKVGYEVLILPLSRALMLKVSEYEKNFRS